MGHSANKPLCLYSLCVRCALCGKWPLPLVLPLLLLSPFNYSLTNLPTYPMISFAFLRVDSRLNPVGLCGKWFAQFRNQGMTLVVPKKFETTHFLTARRLAR